MKTKTSHLVQMVAVSGPWEACFENAENCRVVAWGLDSNGAVFGLIADGGKLANAETASGDFCGYRLAASEIRTVKVFNVGCDE